MEGHRRRAYAYTDHLTKTTCYAFCTEDADLVFVPVTVLWASYNFDDIDATMADFASKFVSFLPLVDLKPHFLILPRVTFFSGLELEQFAAAGITLLTIEGDSSEFEAIIEIPYPSHYHHHSGLAHNRFMHKALVSKTYLAYECFATSYHHSDDLLFREALLAACLSVPEDCQHASPDFTSENLNNQAMQLFTNASNAWFCMQPAGHSLTRRSLFDCLLAGSIPVVFEAESLDHFPWSDIVNPLDMML